MPWAVPQCVDYDHWCQGTSWYKPKIDAVCKPDEVLLRNDADKNRLCQVDHRAGGGGLEKGLAGLYRIPTKCGPCNGQKESCFMGEEGKEEGEKLKGITPYHIEAQMQLIYDSCYARGASHITESRREGTSIH